MKKEEALIYLGTEIMVLENMIKYNKDFEPKNDCENLINKKQALEIAIKALEKQIPKKVIFKSWSPSVCPTCGTELSEDLGDGYYRHRTFLEVCPNKDCCQRLYWN